MLLAESSKRSSSSSSDDDAVPDAEGQDGARAMPQQRPQPAVSSMHMVAAPKKKVAAKSKGAAKKDERSSSLPRSNAKSKSGKGDPEDYSQLDEDMLIVQKRLGGPLQACLLGLDVSRHLAGEKLGVRVAGVLGSAEPGPRV